MNTTDKPNVPEGHGVIPKDLPNRPTTPAGLLQPGTISHGTMRAQDLVPAFLDALRACNPVLAEQLDAERPSIYSDEMPEWLNETLWDAMDKHAPEGHYFGSHPGDGSDYGIWPIEAEDAQ